jgi:subtilisin family serine protease
VLVKFKPVLSTQKVQTTLSQSGLEIREYYPGIDVHRCRVTEQVDALAAARSCATDSSVVYAEPNYIYRASAVPDDPRWSELWGLQNANGADIDAPEAWDVSTGSRNVLVAVIDTGVDYTHEDLRDNMWRNPGETGDGKENNGIDDDNNGYVDDVHGWDFVSDDNDPMDDNQHGSHVAGTIAAVGDNGVGVVGVNWSASVMALKFLDANGSGSASDAIDAILYAANNGARIENNSWGGGGYSQALQDAIEYARDRNVLFVAAAGNEGNDNDRSPSYPASYEVSNVLSVAASDRNDQLASFSNTGATSVDLAAPGVEILSTTPGDRYQTFSGTSMATPHASGAAALVMARFPGIDQRHVLVRLASSVDRKPAFDGRTVTGGRLNVHRALSTDPQVAFVTRLDDTSDTEGPYVVTAEAVDDGAIHTASLITRVDDGAPVRIVMTATAPTLYRGEITGQASGSSVSYLVEVADDAGNIRRSSEFTFHVGDGDGGGEEPPPCGNFALTLPGPGSSKGPWGTLAVQLAILGLVWIALKRRVRA